MNWLITTMDDGLIDSADTKYEAYEKVERRAGNIWYKRRIRAGLYEVITGYHGDVYNRTFYVGRPQALAADGFQIPPEAVRYRAQANGVNGWVDGGLFKDRARAEADAERLAAQYGVEVRVVEVTG